MRPSLSPDLTQLMIAVRVLGEEKSLAPETLAQFEAADKWLKPMSFE